ncbi:30S ribosomal protein S2 [Candidatus Uhrbacteria bacterium]|nr:30S ribosomal protein S2 [Candidatus Uhrbacteria bacterium]
MVKVPTLVEMLQSGVHFGHIKGKWHPKMAQFIFSTRNDVHIINLEETAKQLQNACQYLGDLGSRRALVLFVGTKRQAVGVIESAAKRIGMPYVTKRWLGGTLTNFAIIQKLIQQYLSLKSILSSEQRNRYTKKEQLGIERKVEKLDVSIGGLTQLSRKPDAIVIVDLKRERTAIREAAHTKTSVVAITDTNTNPDKVAYPIPANDDAVGSVEMIVNILADAYQQGRESAAAEPQAAPAPVN